MDAIGNVLTVAAVPREFGTLLIPRNINSTSNNIKLILTRRCLSMGALLLQDNDGHNASDVRRISLH